MNEYEFDYDSIVEDSDELIYEDDDYSYEDEREYDYYYHNVMNELDND